MGRYADGLEHRIRGRRVAKDVVHPRGFKGMVMWCSSCRMELLRSRDGKVSNAVQQAAYDAHMKVCELRHLPRDKMRRRIVRGARRILLRGWWARNQHWVLIALLFVLGILLIRLFG